MATLLEQAHPDEAVKPPEIRLHAIVFQRGEWWIGTCLEHIIPSQARTREALLSDIERMIRTYLRWSEEDGGEPFALVPRAPKRYWEMHRNGSVERIEVVVIRSAPAVSAVVELRAA